MVQTPEQQKKFAAENMSYADQLIKQVADNHGIHSAALMEDVMKTQKKQIDQAMMDHGMSAEEMAQSKGINIGSLSKNPKIKPAGGLMAPATVTPEGDIQQGGALSWIGGHSTNDLLNQLLKVSEINKNSNGLLSSQISEMKESDKKENAQAIADGIESGNQLADFKSLYGLAGPVKAELQRRGVDVAKLQLQATAETKLAQTLNGPQQVRLKQSIESVMGGLDELDNLNSEFQRSGIKLFNKGQLEALANGAGTPEQQELAQRFKTQIIGLQDEFGNVVMGGNSPTDRALELAGKIFNSDFNNTAISAATKQMRRLLAMRKSAIDNIGSANAGQAKENTPAGVGTAEIPAYKGGYSDFRKMLGR